MSRPFVSVLIDTYNHEKFIERAITSALEQNFSPADYEILVVDDGSTDRTPEIVKKFAPRVVHLRKPNGGQASAFNYGIPRCRGAIVAFLDGDDWWAPNKLSTVSAAMDADHEIGIVGNAIVIVQPDGQEEKEILLEGNRFRANTPAGAKTFRVRGSFLGTSRMTIRTSVLSEIGPIPESIVFEADEYVFTLAAVLHGALILPDFLTYYRLHNANLYQGSTADPERERRKQIVLQELATALGRKFEELKIDRGVARIITNNVRADADLIRLSRDGGMPWETFQTEWRMYQRVIATASPLHRAFRFLTLVSALFLPPRWYYGCKRRIAQSDRYRHLRSQLLPNPTADHVGRTSGPNETAHPPTALPRPRG